ncbi:hypothetical protein RB595_001608 [Gaeumannomyces hyphopodioides]
MTESLPTREYPGMGLKLRYWCPENMSRHLRDKPTYPIAAHTESCYLISPIIYVREAAMMIVMETLTDKAEWHKKVFDDVIVARWRKEALAIPDEVFWDQITSFKTQDPADQSEENEAPELKPVGIMSEKAFDWCVEELRAKARHFEETGVVVTLDLGASVAKSDTLVTPELHAELQASFAKLKADQASTPDWHPKTDEKVQNLVHPSMYPLVYGRTRVLRQEVVGVADAIDLWAGKGDVLPKCTGDPAADALPFHSVRVPSDFWSDTFQWLPSNVAFHDDGGIRFTSYINNLHPQKYPRIYRALERLIATSIPLWEQCLTEFTLGRKIDGPGQRSARIPQQDKEQWDPANMEECADMEVDPGLLEPGRYKWQPEMEQKWRILRKAVHPEPGSPGEDSRSYQVPPKCRLATKFKDSGLQVIVKMASIELTPDKPVFPAGGWHVEGQMNECICATALYYLDSENITPSHLAFRMETDTDDEIPYEQGEFDWHEQVYGTFVTDDPQSACLQNYGSVETKQGRLLAFPNVFQHRVSSFRLADPTKPGHRRFVALWLVDPHKRIISTANVPPQQRSWWAESVLGVSARARKEVAAKFPPEVLRLVRRQAESAGDKLSGKGVGPGDEATTGPMAPRLPEELVQMIQDHSKNDDMLMSEEEARKHRLALMAERSRYNTKANDLWNEVTYNFCEH